jgi:Cys-tRNA(Pro) deacylase
MSKEEYPVTTAVRFLRDHNVEFKPFLYRYEEHGGTHQFAAEYHVPEHRVIKTLVMEDEHKKPVLVLMHGDCEVSTKQLARELGVKQIVPCDARTATRHTGYQFGGTGPFGTRTVLPVCVEKTIFELESIYINGGKRGFILELPPQELRRTLSIREVSVAIPV